MYKAIVYWLINGYAGVSFSHLFIQGSGRVVVRALKVQHTVRAILLAHLGNQQHTLRPHAGIFEERHRYTLLLSKSVPLNTFVYLLTLQ